MFVTYVIGVRDNFISHPEIVGSKIIVARKIIHCQNTEISSILQSYKTVLFELKQDKTNIVTCAPSKDSDQPGWMPSLIRVFAVDAQSDQIFAVCS